MDKSIQPRLVGQIAGDSAGLAINKLITSDHTAAVGQAAPACRYYGNRQRPRTHATKMLTRLTAAAQTSCLQTQCDERLHQHHRVLKPQLQLSGNSFCDMWRLSTRRAERVQLIN